MEVEQLSIIVDASMDSEKRKLLEQKHPELCIYLCDQVFLQNAMKKLTGE